MTVWPSARPAAYYRHLLAGEAEIGAPPAALAPYLAAQCALEPAAPGIVGISVNGISHRVSVVWKIISGLYRRCENDFNVYA